MNSIDFDKLPSPPGVAIRLLELFSSPDLSLNDLIDVIGADPIMTGRLIKYANSPTFARQHEADSLRQAVTMLGANGVKTIALSFSLTEVGSENAGGRFSYDNFWNSSLATAVCAKAIFDATSNDGDQGFLIGLLLNVGQLAMYWSDPSAYESLLESKSEHDPELVELESKEFGETRFALGGQVLNSWNFPGSIADSLANYNTTADSTDLASQCLDLANRMSFILLNENPDYETVQKFTEDLKSITGLTCKQAEELFSSVSLEHGEFASILTYEHLPQRSLKEIELEAKLKMVEMTMELQLANANVMQENSQLKDMAYVDALTGLGNRRQYDKIATSELERCKRTKRSIGLIVIDIDHFKNVNDTFGHAVGDAILVAVAGRLANVLRSYDWFFRFGGEEFVVVLPESTKEICRCVLERLRTSIEAEFFIVEDHEIPVTVSLGGAVVEPWEGAINVEGLFERADKALYTAKETGRNRWVLETPETSFVCVPMPRPE